MDYTQEARERFSADRFATKCTGIVIEHAEEQHAKCYFDITKDHLNIDGGVMGGAIFTLADFTFAVAANVGAPHTVLVSGAINFMGTSKGKRLIAEAMAVKSGRNMVFYQTSVTDDLGNPVATLSSTGYRKGEKL